MVFYCNNKQSQSKCWFKTVSFINHSVGGRDVQKPLLTCYNSQQNNVNFQTTAVVRFLFFKLWQNYLHLFTTGVYCHLKNLCTSKFRIK